MLGDFKPTILFLAKFLGLYLGLNLLYGAYIDSYSPKPDPITRVVSHNTIWLLEAINYDISYEDDGRKPAINLIKDDQVNILSVYEGCNGCNIMIIFVSFLLAFTQKFDIRWFKYLILGIVIVYVSNLLRIAGLFLIAERAPHLMYFMHKYLFTGLLYLIIFAIWYLWVAGSRSKKVEHAEQE